MITRHLVISAVKTLALYAAAGYYLAQAVHVLRPVLDAPEHGHPAARPKRPCPCTARAAAGAHAAPEAPDDGA